MKPTYFTVAEAAAALGVDRRTVYRWIASGDLTVDTIAGRILLRESAVNRKAKQRKGSQ